MRVVLVAAIALFSSGCFSAESSSVEPGAPSAADPAESAPPAAPGGAPSIDPAVARAPVDVSHDYSAAAESITFDVVAGEYKIDIGFRAPDSVMGCVSADARIVVNTPNGKVYADEQLQGVTTPCEGTQGGKHAAAEFLLGGVWTAEFTGSGVAVANIHFEPV